MEVLNNGIINNKVNLVPLKWSFEGIGIDDEDEKDNTKNVGP